MKKKFVIFTAVIGSYDVIKQPLVVDERFDYILFSNDIKEKCIGVWQVRPIHYFNPIQTKIARWVKTHPEELLLDYEACVWVDASVLIKSAYVYDKAISLYESNELISTLVNPELDCIYQEMLSMMFLGFETEKVTIKWGQYLRKEKYPRCIGTNETRILFRKHSDIRLRNFDNMWWWCINNCSRRDQFSFHYVLWKQDLKHTPFLPESANVRDSEHIEVIDHSNDRNKYLRGEGCDSCLLRYYRKHVNERSSIENVYYWIYARHYPFFWLKLIGSFYRVKHFVCYLFGRKNDYNYAREVKKIKNRVVGGL